MFQVQNQKDKSMVFALKYLKKYDVVSQHQQEHVINERSIQMACRSPFIVRMYRTFRDNKFVFFLMEPCLGTYITISKLIGTNSPLLLTSSVQEEKNKN